MKFAVVAAVASLAVVSAADCEIGKLAPVASNSHAMACTADSGYSLIPPSTPSDAVLQKMCASKSCVAVLADLKAAQPTECTVTIAVPPVPLYAGLLDPINSKCQAIWAKTGTPSATTTSPSATTTAPSATTKTPSTTTTAPSATTKAPSSNSTSTTTAPATTTATSTTTSSGSGASTTTTAGSSTAETVSTPASTTSAPKSTTAPTATKSGAATIATAAGAVFAAVVASLF